MDPDIPAPVFIPNPSEIVTPPDETEREAFYYILRTGAIMGPLSIRTIARMAHAHQLTRGDFVQIAGNSNWLPLAEALDPGVPPPDGTPPAPEFPAIMRWSWMRLRYNLGEKSLSAGLVCLGMASLGVMLTQWPSAFWAPLLVPPVLAWIRLLRKRRFVAGAFLFAGIASIPLLAQKWVGFGD
ncbi:MAG: domain 2 [Verrucomicrobiota bacterium]|jgi:hypothetical protein